MSKKVKRDVEQRAFTRGYQAGINGKSKELCPHTAPTGRQSWLDGWREGRGDLWGGMQGVSAIHRLPTI